MHQLLKTLGVIAAVIVMTIILDNPPSQIQANEAESIDTAETQEPEKQQVEEEQKTESKEEQVEEEQVEEKLSEAELRKKLIKENPEKCDLDYQVILYPDGKCSGEKPAEAKKVTEPVEQEKVAETSSYTPTGNKADWLAASKIPSSDWSIVDTLIQKESSWNPGAINPSSGACGLGQQLPCGKWDSYGAWNNPVAALNASHDYVVGRYGSWGGAWSFWNCIGTCSWGGSNGWTGQKNSTWY